MFRSARELQRLSQSRVAELTEQYDRVSRATLSDIECGRSLPTLPALVSLSRALRLEPVEVLERVDTAVGPPVDVTGVPLDELKLRAEESFWSGDYRGALAFYDAMLEALALHPVADPVEQRRLHARTETNRAVALRRCSALAAAQISAQRAVDLAAGFPTLQAEAYMVLASLLSQQGFSVLARDTAERAVVLAESGEAKLQGQTRTQKGDVLFRAGLFEEARRAFVEAQPLARRARDHRTRIKLEGNIGACFAETGLPGRARKHYASAVALARRHGDPAGEAFWLVELGRIALGQGRRADADRFALAALRIAKPLEHLLTVFRAEWLRHLAAGGRQPGAEDRSRLGYLRRLYPRIKAHHSVDAVREFERAVLRPEDPSRP